MAQRRQKKKAAPSRNTTPDNGATSGHEAELWRMADTLRGSMDAAEHGKEAAEDADEYIGDNIFWVPPKARWARLKKRARQPAVGKRRGGIDAKVIADLVRDVFTG